MKSNFSSSIFKVLASLLLLSVCQYNSDEVFAYPLESDTKICSHLNRSNDIKCDQTLLAMEQSKVVLLPNIWQYNINEGQDFCHNKYIKIDLNRYSEINCAKVAKTNGSHSSNFHFYLENGNVLSFITDNESIKTESSNLYILRSVWLRDSEDTRGSVILATGKCLEFDDSDAFGMICEGMTEEMEFLSSFVTLK